MRATSNSKTTFARVEVPSSDKQPIGRTADCNHLQGGLWRPKKRFPISWGLIHPYVERTDLTSRQMNGRMVGDTLSFFKIRYHKSLDEKHYLQTPEDAC